MSEIRIKQKNLIIIIIIICFLLFILTVNNKCENVNLEINELLVKNANLPPIYAITPTYARPTQKAELTRLAHTIMLVPNIHWIIIEDAVEKSKLVESLLIRTKLNARSTLLNAKTPSDYKLKEKDPNWSKPRGVEQRNLGLSWVRNHLKNFKSSQHSLIYFMDDDNTYSIELFEQISMIKSGKVGVWPVGLVGGLMVEKPVLTDDNEVIGFNSVWRPERPFPIDMAGFAISSTLLLEHNEAVFNYEVHRGYQESEILRHLTTVRDLQPLANFCKDVLVWHTRTETPKLDAENKLKKEGQRSDDGMEV